MNAGGNTSANVVGALRKFAGRDFASAEEAEKWWAGASKVPESQDSGKLASARTVEMPDGAGRPFGFSPDGKYILCRSSQQQLRIVPVHVPKESTAYPWSIDCGFVWGYADGERFWIRNGKKIEVIRDGKIESALECPPFVSSAVLIAEKDELWVADPRRCSVTIHNTKGEREPREIPLAPTIGRRYLRLSHVPGASAVAASNAYARSGYLIDIDSKSVKPSPDLAVPWRNFNPAYHAPDGKTIWSLKANGLVQLDSESGKVVKQLFFSRLSLKSHHSQRRVTPAQPSPFTETRSLDAPPAKSSYP
jgi:hypothetical protein